MAETFVMLTTYSFLNLDKSPTNTMSEKVVIIKTKTKPLSNAMASQ